MTATAAGGNVVPIRGQVERFVGACLENVDGARATGGDIIKTYVGWCIREGEQPYRPNDVMPALKAIAGVQSVKGSTGRIEYRGVRLKVA